MKKNSCWIIWLGSRWMHPSPPAAPILSAFRNFAFRAIAIVGGSCGRGRPNGVKTLLSPHGVSHAEGVERNAAAEFGGGGGLSKSGIRFFRPLQARPLGRGPTTQMPCRSLPAVRATLCLLVDCAGRMTQPHVEISQPGGAGGRAGGRAGGWISSHRREGGGAEGICGLAIPLPRHSTPPPMMEGQQLSCRLQGVGTHVLRIQQLQEPALVSYCWAVGCIGGVGCIGSCPTQRRRRQHQRQGQQRWWVGP